MPDPVLTPAQRDRPIRSIHGLMREFMPVAKALVCPKCDGERIIHRPIRLGRAS